MVRLVQFVAFKTMTFDMNRVFFVWDRIDVVFIFISFTFDSSNIYQLGTKWENKIFSARKSHTFLILKYF